MAALPHRARRFFLAVARPGPARARAEGTNRHDPEEDFYGLGADSREADRVSFLFDRRDVEGRAIVKPGGGLQAGIRVGRVATSVGAGRDSRFPSIEERFSDVDAPGLAQQPDFSIQGSFRPS